MAVVLVIGLIACVGCSDDGGGDAVTSTTTARGETQTACEALLGRERSQIPDAVEYLGLDGSVRYLRQRVGTAAAGDAHVFVDPSTSDLLDDVAEDIAAIPGATVLASVDQDQVFSEFVRIYGEGAEGSTEIRPSMLPPFVDVRIDDQSALRAIEALNDDYRIYEVTFREDVELRVAAALPLVVDQFKRELEVLVDDAPVEVGRAASAMLELSDRADTRDELIEDAVMATEAIMKFVDDICVP